MWQSNMASWEITAHWNVRPQAINWGIAMRKITREWKENNESDENISNYSIHLDNVKGFLF